MDRYLEEALDLAAQGIGQTSPNPAVGAVLVRDGEVVGRGSHTWAGVKHAEVLALEEAGERSNGATLEVTALVDQFYAQVQAMGGRRWDTSSLAARLKR